MEIDYLLQQKKRRLAIISIRGTSRSGGLERVVQQHADLLDGRYEVRVVGLPASGFLGELWMKSRIAERFFITVFPLFSSMFARIWAGRRGIVVSHGYSSTGIGCDAVFAHGCTAAYFTKCRLTPGPFSRLAMLYEASSACFARKIVSVSEEVANQWVASYSMRPKKSRILGNRVNMSEFYPSSGSAVVCDKKTVKALFVGRLEPGKGVDYLHELHEQMSVRTAWRDVQVTLCSPLSTKMTSLDFPRFVIKTGLDAQQLRHEYNRADLFLLPSRYEAFELSSLEALACGTPVMLNDTGTRPTLEKLGCPALFKLEDAPTPLDAIYRAILKFKGMSRGTIADWTASRFSGKELGDELQAILEAE